MNGVDHEAIKLKLIPFSLKEKVRNLFQNLAQSIETWGQMVEVFLTKFFLPKLTSQL